MNLFISRFCNGGLDVLSLFSGDPWVGGRWTVGQKYPGKKPQNTCYSCDRRGPTQCQTTKHIMLITFTLLCIPHLYWNTHQTHRTLTAILRQSHIGTAHQREGRRLHYQGECLQWKSNHAIKYIIIMSEIVYQLPEKMMVSSLLFSRGGAHLPHMANIAGNVTPWKESIIIVSHC